MKDEGVPTHVRVTCDYCEYRWVVSLDELRAVKVTVHKVDGVETVQRQILCPNCGEYPVVQGVPKAWLGDE